MIYDRGPWLMDRWIGFWTDDCYKCGAVFEPTIATIAVVQLISDDIDDDAPHSPLARERERGEQSIEYLMRLKTM